MIYQVLHRMSKCLWWICKCFSNFTYSSPISTLVRFHRMSSFDSIANCKWSLIKKITKFRTARIVPVSRKVKSIPYECLCAQNIHPKKVQTIPFIPFAQKAPSIRIPIFQFSSKPSRFNSILTNKTLRGLGGSQISN